MPQNPHLTPDSFMAQQQPAGGSLTPDAFMAQQHPAAAPDAWDAVKRGAGAVADRVGQMAEHAKPAAQAIWDVSSPAIAGQLFKKFTGQPNDLGQLPGKLITTGLPLMMGEPEADIAEAAPASRAAAPQPAAQVTTEGTQLGVLGRAMDVAKRRISHIPGVQAVKDLDYIVRGSGDAEAAPQAAQQSVPSNWGKGIYKTPIDQWGQHIPPDPSAIFPGAQQPETPDPRLLQARSLFEGPRSPVDPAAGLFQPPKPGQAGQLTAAMQKPAASAPASQPAPNFNRSSLGGLLDKSVAPESEWSKTLNPRTPLRRQMPATAPTTANTGSNALGTPSGAISGAADTLEGHTPVTSSWIKSYKYDPATREFEMAPKSGTPVRLGDVSPEDAKAFAGAESQGKAWQQIKNNVVVAKRVNGKWIVTPRTGASVAP